MQVRKKPQSRHRYLQCPMVCIASPHASHWGPSRSRPGASARSTRTSQPVFSSTLTPPPPPRRFHTIQVSVQPRPPPYDRAGDQGPNEPCISSDQLRPSDAAGYSPGPMQKRNTTGGRNVHKTRYRDRRYCPHGNGKILPRLVQHDPPRRPRRASREESDREDSTARCGRDHHGSRSWVSTATSMSELRSDATSFRVDSLEGAAPSVGLRSGDTPAKKSERFSRQQLV